MPRLASRSCYQAPRDMWRRLQTLKPVPNSHMAKDDTFWCYSEARLKSVAVTARKPWIALLVFTSLFLACSCAPAELAENARATAVGTTATALVARAGLPTVDRTVDRATNSIDPCAGDPRSVRAFEYHVGFDPVTAPIRKLLHRPTVAAMTVVCLDKDAKVVSTHLRRF